MGPTSPCAQGARKDYLYDSYGAIVEEHGPYLGGASSYPIAARAYDSVGRVALEAQAPISNGATNMPVRAYTYATPTSSYPGSILSYSFVRGSTQTLPYTVGPPDNDDATMSIRYFDGLGRTIQVRTRLGSGASGSTGNVVSGLPVQFVVSENVRIDGLGRTVVAYEPYFSNNGNFVDPRSLFDMASNLHASSVAYDDRSRPFCQMYAPAPFGNYVAAPTDPTQCVSNPTENSSYRRAVRLAYGVDGSLDGRNYLTVDATMDSAAAGAPPGRSYVDALGRARYSRTPTGTSNRRCSTCSANGLRWSGPPGRLRPRRRQ